MVFCRVSCMPAVRRGTARNGNSAAGTPKVLIPIAERSEMQGADARAYSSSRLRSPYLRSFT